MPYKRQKSSVNDSKEEEKRSYIIGYVKRASVADLKKLNKHFLLENEDVKLSKNYFKIQERLIKFVKHMANIKTLNKIYEVLPASY